MNKYNNGDIATFYFVIYDGENKIIKAWSDNKLLVEYYLTFHECKKFYIKKITDSIENISKIIEENYHDEIVLYHALIKAKKGSKLITIPATQTEVNYINEECSMFLYTRIDYSFLNKCIPFLKSKYKKACDDIFLSSIIRKVIEQRDDKYTININLDQLMILYKSFPDTFGK